MAGAQAPAGGGFALPMPSANAFQILAQAPLDMANLFARQANETMNAMNLGVSSIAASLSLPALPFSAPALPALPNMMAAGFPSLPGLPGAGVPTSAPVAAQLYSSQAQVMPVRRIGPRVVV